jgi:hypothetical protein
MDQARRDGMKAAPIAKYLTHFGRGAETPAAPERVVALRPGAVDTAERHARALEQARADGEAAGRAAALREQEARSVAEAESFAVRLLTERETWRETEAERLAASFAGALAEREQALAAQIARLLTPFIGARMADEVWRSLCAAVDGLMAQGAAATLRVDGPADLVEALRTRCAALGVTIEARESDRADVTIRSDDSVVETRLGAWIAMLDATVKG